MYGGFFLYFFVQYHQPVRPDYPHQIGSLTKMKESISRLNISNTDKAEIYGENALTLLNALRQKKSSVTVLISTS